MDHADALPIAELLDERRYLLDVAFWMLGSPREAERVVDEAYRRWYGLSDAARRQIPVPRSWLARTVGELCLSRLARPPETGPEAQVSRVPLNTLDSLSSAERACVLNDVVGTAPGTISDIVGRTAPECVELVERARHCLRMQRSNPTAPGGHDSLARGVRRACQAEDVDLLTSLLCPDATAFFDGGGKVQALTRPVHGGRQVAHSLMTLLARRPRTTLNARSVNGRTGLVARCDRRTAAVVSLDIADQRIAQIWVVLNPDKLRSWNQHDQLPRESGT